MLDLWDSFICKDVLCEWKLDSFKFDVYAKRRTYIFLFWVLRCFIIEVRKPSPLQFRRLLP